MSVLYQFIILVLLLKSDSRSRGRGDEIMCLNIIKETSCDCLECRMDTLEARLDALEKLVCEPKEGDTINVNGVEYRFADLSEMEKQLAERDREIKRLKQEMIYLDGDRHTHQEKTFQIVEHKDAEITERDARIAELEKQLFDARQSILTEGLRVIELEKALLVTSKLKEIMITRGWEP